MTMQELLLYFYAIKKRWWLIVTLCAVTAGAILFSFYDAPPVYKARLQFLVTAPPPGGVTLYPTYREPALSDERAATQANLIAVIKSAAVVVRTVRELGLDLSPGVVLQGISVEESRDSQLVQLAVQGRTPDEAALLANNLIQTALRYYGELRAMPATSSRQFIEQQLKVARQDLQKAQQALIEFQIKNRLTSLQPEIESQQHIVNSLRLARDQAEAEGHPEQIEVYERLIAQREAELQNLGNLRIGYASLEEEASRAGAIYDLLLNKQTEAILKENETLSAAFVQIVEPATPPRSAVPAFNFSLLALGLAVSLVLGVLLSLLLEYLSNMRPKMAQEKSRAQSA